MFPVFEGRIVSFPFMHEMNEVVTTHGRGISNLLKDVTIIIYADLHSTCFTLETDLLNSCFAASLQCAGRPERHGEAVGGRCSGSSPPITGVWLWRLQCQGCVILRPLSEPHTRHNFL